MGLNSLSALRNRGNLRPKVILIIPSAVSHAARKGKHGRIQAMATAIGIIAMGITAMGTGHNAKCFLRYAPSVEKLHRYHLNPAKTGRGIVAIATTRLDSAGHASLHSNDYTIQIRE